MNKDIVIAFDIQSTLNSYNGHLILGMMNDMKSIGCKTIIWSERPIAEIQKFLDDSDITCDYIQNKGEMLIVPTIAVDDNKEFLDILKEKHGVIGIRV